jgi:Sulfotransferase family
MTGKSDDQDTNTIVQSLLDSVSLDDADVSELRPGLEVAVAALYQDRGLTPPGREQALAQYRDNLNRLQQISDDRRRYPAIADQEIKAPIFILGLPRCGTSMLHALMAADPAVRSPLMWEVAAPSPPPQAQSCETDPRIAAYDKFVDETFVGEWAGVRKAHPIGARIPQECGMILETAFRSINPVTMFRIRAFYQWYLDNDMSYGYRVHRRWLQHLQWQNPGKRWVLKVQEHMYNIPQLLSVYPDAVFVQPHRDPRTVLASISRLIYVIRSIAMDDQDLKVLGKEMLHLWHDGQVRMMAYRREHPDLPVHDVSFKSLLADPVEAVRGIYTRYGLEFTPAAQSGIVQWLADNPADKHGKHSYTLEDYGLSIAQIETVYGDYIDTYRDYL